MLLKTLDTEKSSFAVENEHGADSYVFYFDKMINFAIKLEIGRSKKGPGPRTEERGTVFPSLNWFIVY